MVLDDDQEMPPSERHPRKPTSISLENFDEDEGGGKMPDLPKI